MSYCSNIFSIYVKGPRKEVRRMLNAAISNVGTGDLIVDGDDIVTINRKVKEEDGHYGLRISLQDLLNEQSLISERFINIHEVTNHNEEYEVKLNFYIGEEEGHLCPDYANLIEIARQYQCMVTVDDIQYLDGKFDTFYGARIFEPQADGVKEIYIEPMLDVDAYAIEFEKLIKMDDKYRALMIRNLETKIHEMQQLLSDVRQYQV